MNKLLVSDIIDINSGIYIIEFNNKKAKINIGGNTTIYIINEEVEELEINLKDGSSLNLYKYDKFLKSNLNIKINEYNNTLLNFNNNFINNNNVVVKIDNYIKGNNNESNINIRNISLNNLSKIIINVDILDNTINNIALEDLKGINNGGIIQIEPNILCGSNEVTANHLTTIGELDKNSIDYLMSKGIDEVTARNILLNGFICNKMDDYMKKIIGGE